MKKVLILLICALFVLIAGCGPKIQTERIEMDEQADLSGRWNDTDSRMVSDAMIEDALNRPWLRQFKNNNSGHMPTVIVGTVKNRSHEHINVETFVRDIQRALINSGHVSFVASARQRQELRDERLDQASHASETTAGREGEEIGADFMMQGAINTIEDRVEGRRVMYYQVNLELIDIETNRTVWMGEKKIRKIIRQRRFSF